MHIKMLTTSASPEVVRMAGQTYLVSSEEAASLLEDGYAVLVDDGQEPGENQEVAAIPEDKDESILEDEGIVESTAIATPETATKNQPLKRR